MQTSNCVGCNIDFSYPSSTGATRNWCDDCKQLNNAKPELVYQTCKGCQTNFTHNFHVGRPEVWCAICQADPDLRKRILDKERRDRQLSSLQFDRVANLEMMLKSRGTHISQN